MKLFFFLFVFSTSVFAELKESADFICKSYNGKILESDYSKNAGESFRKAFPIDKHNDFFKNLRDDFGKCTSVTFEKLEKNSALVKVTTPKMTNFLKIFISEKELITGLWFKNSLSVDGDIEKQAKYICGLFKKDSKLDYDKHFTKGFTSSVPLKTFSQIINSIFDQYGECESFKLNIKRVDYGELKTKHSKKLKFLINIDKSSRLISGLLFKGEDTPEVHIKDEKHLKTLFNSLPGKKSMLFKELGEDANFSINRIEDFALGSTFKLYILLALEDKIKKGELSWTMPLVIKEELKSLPSGVMQNIKAGETREIFFFARKMIEISDNTATDHLLELVGKESVEKVVKSLGVSNSGNTPFLSTMEMFRTRAFFSSADVEKFKNSSRKNRLKMLERLKLKSREELIKGIQSWGNTPKYISSIEWFSSASDICNLLKKLKDTKSKNILKILSYNAPFVTNGLSDYAGYKGGSEPGVLYMSYLLRKNDKWSCFIASQNNTEKAINQDKFFSIIEGSLKFFLKE